MALSEETFVDEGIIADDPRPTHTARMERERRVTSLVQLAQEADGKARHYPRHQYAQHRKTAFEARKQARSIQNNE